MTSEAFTTATTSLPSARPRSSTASLVIDATRRTPPASSSTFAAVRAQTEGPRLAALVLLDPSDERLGELTYDSSLTVAPSVTTPTIDLASEENQHPIQCNMTDGTDCTLVANQEYQALTGARTVPEKFTRSRNRRSRNLSTALEKR